MEVMTVSEIRINAGALEMMHYELLWRSCVVLRCYSRGP
jgi:hypothetical protein